MPDKIKVLFLAADPFRDGAPLRLDEEVRAVDLAIQRGRARDAVELVPHFATRVGDLQHALLRHEPQVVHFAGHGDAPGVIYLGDDGGNPKAVGKEALARLFGILKGSVRAVVLNGCDTLPTVEAIGEAVDFVIGMNRPISDESAIDFAEAFYGALAMGRSVLTAFELGKIRLQLDGSDEADVPVLRVRPGADPEARLVTLPPAAATPPAGPPAGPGQRIRIGDLHAKRNVGFTNEADGEGGSGQDIGIEKLSADGDVSFDNR
jgi:CHAT domain